MASQIRNDGIAQRLGQLATEHSQAEIARRTGERVNNVNRYLHGTRVPAHFLAALTKRMGVSPAWLLGGEGARYAADVTTGTANLAGDMLELVRALREVETLRLASIDTSHHRGLLRKLRDAMTDYQKIRERLSLQSRGVLKRLLDDLKNALDNRDLALAGDLLEAANQVRNLCHDRDLAHMHMTMSAYFEYQRGNVQASADRQREAFLRFLPGASVTEETVEDAVHLASALGTLRQMHEVRRVANATLALAEGVGENWSWFQILRMIRASANADLMAAPDATADTLQIFNGLDAKARFQQVGRVLRVLLVSGTLESAGALTFGPINRLSAGILLKHALRIGDVELVREYAEACVGPGLQYCEPDSQEAIAGRAVLARRFSLGAFEREMERATHYPLPKELAQFQRYMFTARTTALRGNWRACRKHTQLAADELASAAPDVTHELVSRAIHHSTVVALHKRQLPAGDLTRAESFFERARAYGFRALRPL